MAQGVLQRRLPAVGVQAQFALGDHAVLVRVHEFHRVFHRDDVAERVFIAPVDHGRQRGRFARAGGTDQDAQAAFGHRDILQRLGHAQAVDGGQGGRNHPQHHADLALLHEGADAEAADGGRRDRKVALLGAFEIGGLLVAHDRAGQRLCVRAAQGLGRQFGDLAVHLDRRGEVGGDEQVAAIAADHEPQQIVDELAGLVAFHGRLGR